MSTNKKLFFNMIFAQVSFLLLITISYFTAISNITQTMEEDIDSLAGSIQKMSSVYAKQNKDGFLNADFKKAISEIKVGRTGYVYFLDESGKLIIHPSLEGKSLAGVPFIDEIRANKNGGILSYFYEPTNSDKLVGYRYIPEWKMWAVPGINKSDYLNEINEHFLLYIVGLGLLLMFSQGLIAYLVNKGISNNINSFNEYFKEFLNFVSLKQNKIQKVTLKGKSEFSGMMNEINTTIDEFDTKFKTDMRVIGEIVLTLDKVEQGIFRCRVKSKTTNPMVMTLRSTINQMLKTLEANMIELETVTKAYSQDDFTEQINISPRLKARLLAVMQGVNGLGDSLSNAAKLNLENGQILENNASIMKTSMHNLASKANDQAASLEETSAAVEEITSITRNNAQNAVKMATLGQTVKKAVSQGQELASQTAESMEEINSKVSSINEAITVIDQIAFQTNILSLNAAVEAATAGEAGKGFAVVAQEVRNLASRSAEAAKEIKDLVEDANSKANQGKNISDNMINGYETLNNHISETINIIDDVSSSSREQMTGIEQINDAITLLDRVTQENASEANQVTEISTEVSNMAHNLLTDAKNKKFN